MRTTVATTIASIRAQTWTDWELIVIGQGQDDPVQPVVAAEAKGDSRIRYVNVPKRAVSPARNAGLAAATGDIVAMTDDDSEARADWLAVIAESFESDSDLGVVGGAIFGGPRTWRRVSSNPSIVPGEVLYEPARARPPAPAGFDWYTGNFAIRREVARNVGPFDEFLGPGGLFLSCEDIDYKLRAEAAGVKMLSTPRSVVFHTYGRRYGVRALVKTWHRNETGSGAVAAKFTLRGDPRGREWVEGRLRENTVSLLRRPAPHQILASPVRLQAFLRAYRRCLRDFELDAHGLLAPKVTAGSR